MGSMFDGARSFDQPLEGWNTAKVTDMRRMFCGTSSFDQPLEGWNTAKVTDMEYMFICVFSLAQKPSWFRGY